MKTKIQEIFDFHKETGESFSLCKFLYEKYQGDFKKSISNYQRFSCTHEFHEWKERENYKYKTGIS